MSELLKEAIGLGSVGRLLSGVGKATKATGRLANKAVDTAYDLGTFVPPADRWTAPGAKVLGSKILAKALSPFHALAKNFTDARIPFLDRTKRTTVVPYGPTNDVVGWAGTPIGILPRAWANTGRRLGQDILDTWKSRDWQSWDNRLQQFGLKNLPGRERLAAGLDVAGHVAGRTIKHTPFVAGHAAVGQGAMGAYDFYREGLPTLVHNKLYDEFDAADDVRNAKDPKDRTDLDNAVPLWDAQYPDTTEDGSHIANGPNSPLKRITARMRNSPWAMAGLGWEAAREALRRQLGYGEAKDMPTRVAGDIVEQFVTHKRRQLYKNKHSDPMLFRDKDENVTGVNFPGIVQYPKMMTTQGWLMNLLSSQLAKPLSTEETDKANKAIDGVTGGSAAAGTPEEQAEVLKAEETLKRISAIPEDKRTTIDNMDLGLAKVLVTNSRAKKQDPGSQIAALKKQELSEIIPRRMQQYREAARAGNPEGSSDDVPIVGYLKQIFDTEDVKPYLLSYLYNRQEKIKEPIRKKLEQYVEGYVPKPDQPLPEDVPTPDTPEEPKTRADAERERAIRVAMRYGIPLGAGAVGLYGAKAIADKMHSDSEEKPRKKRKSKKKVVQ